MLFIQKALYKILLKVKLAIINNTYKGAINGFY